MAFEQEELRSDADLERISAKQLHEWKQRAWEKRIIASASGDDCRYWVCRRGQLFRTWSCFHGEYDGECSPAWPRTGRSTSGVYRAISDFYTCVLSGWDSWWTLGAGTIW